jgi:hypothetical protein
MANLIGNAGGYDQTKDIDIKSRNATPGQP